MEEQSIVLRVSTEEAHTAPPFPDPSFVRGDVDANGSTELSDAINLLLHLFHWSFDPPCRDAVDVDDNG